MMLTIGLWESQRTIWIISRFNFSETAKSLFDFSESIIAASDGYIEEDKYIFREFTMLSKNLEFDNILVEIE